VETTGIREDYCTRLFGVYDLVKNTFPQAKLLHANTSYLTRKKFPETFAEIGAALGKTTEESQKAFKTALERFNAVRADAVKKQEELIKEDGLKVLIAAHSYNTYDAALGKSVIKYFNENGVKVVFADLIDDKIARAKTKELHGNRIYWKVNSELLGGVELLKDYVDGVVLISTFPCGPDSIFNELMIRTIKDKPVLSLVMDELDATAGLMTRLESFTDILTMREALKNRYRTSEGL
jgi:predicted nucleotide-binding protein (sugar kinase/HSP70/actin superfamily)